MKTIWSHSSITQLMNNPAEWYLTHVQKIKPKQEKTALSIGSAIHWGLENQTSDLSDYYNEKGSFRQYNNYDDEQCLAECIVEAFLKRQDEIYGDLLTNGNELLDVIDISKELSLVSNVPSKMYKDGHDFIGIIDLLITTDKGFILVDYKTSSKDVDWDQYKSQLFKYKYQLNYNFPELPLLKVVIINLKKTSIRRKKNENDDSYKSRIKTEYLIDKDLINWHTYKNEEFDENALSNFVSNLSSMLDLGQTMLDHNMFFINYSNISGMYGESQFANIYYNVPNAHYLYMIDDIIYDEDEQKVVNERDCDPIDMLVLKTNVLNKYKEFKKQFKEYSGVPEKDVFFNYLKNKFVCSDKLLELYWTTLQKNC